MISAPVWSALIYLFFLGGGGVLGKNFVCRAVGGTIFLVILQRKFDQILLYKGMYTDPTPHQPDPHAC